MRVYEETFTAGQTIDTENFSFIAILENSGGISAPLEIQYFKVTGEGVGLDAAGVISGYEATLPSYAEEPSKNLYRAKITSQIAQTVKIAISRGDGSGRISRGFGTTDVLSLPRVDDYDKANVSQTLYTINEFSSNVAGQYNRVVFEAKKDVLIHRIGQISDANSYCIANYTSGVTVAAKASKTMNRGGSFPSGDFHTAKSNVVVGAILLGDGLFYQYATADQYNETETSIILRSGDQLEFENNAVNAVMGITLFYEDIS